MLNVCTVTGNDLGTQLSSVYVWVGGYSLWVILECGLCRLHSGGLSCHLYFSSEGQGSCPATAV